MKTPDTENRRVHRLFKIPIKDYGDWRAAAQLSGVSLQIFITAACNAAAAAIKEKYGRVDR
jgi:hypothetical protein